MPNWCNNKLKVTHSDPAALEKFKDAWNAGCLLQTLIPCPKELLETRSVGYPKSEKKSYEQRLQEFREQLNIEFFGYKDWYDYNTSAWGTKWDIGYRDDQDNLATVDNESIEVTFDSAWSPPIDAYDKLVDMGYGIEAYYFEPGMAFCGRYDEAGGLTLQIKGNSKWARKNIPRDIDDAFNISENMAEWEAA